MTVKRQCRCQDEQFRESPTLEQPDLDNLFLKTPTIELLVDVVHLPPTATSNVQARHRYIPAHIEQLAPVREQKRVVLASLGRAENYQAGLS